MSERGREREGGRERRREIQTDREADRQTHREQQTEEESEREGRQVDEVKNKKEEKRRVCVCVWGSCLRGKQVAWLSMLYQSQPRYAYLTKGICPSKN